MTKADEGMKHSKADLDCRHRNVLDSEGVNGGLTILKMRKGSVDEEASDGAKGGGAQR